MKKRLVIINQNEKLIIKTVSIKSVILETMYLFAVGLVVYLIIIFLKTLLEETDLIIWIVLPLISIVALLSSINSFLWLRQGYEYLQIDRIDETFQFYRKGLFKFNKRKFTLNEVKSIEVYSPNNEDFIKNRDSLHNQIGLYDGRVAIHLKDRTITFGADLEDTEYEQIFQCIHRFITLSPLNSITLKGKHLLMINNYNHNYKLKT